MKEGVKVYKIIIEFKSGIVLEETKLSKWNIKRVSTHYENKYKDTWSGITVKKLTV